jgi:hypothetical protein
MKSRLMAGEATRVARRSVEPALTPLVPEEVSDRELVERALAAFAARRGKGVTR